ncbi:hypothetical protein ACSW9O_15305 (plasmid) [Clostridium perfringens]
MGVKCDGRTAKDCWECGRYFSAYSSHYDGYYNCHIEEINCSYGGCRIFKDEDDSHERLR